MRHTVESLNILETLGLISGIFYSTIASGDVNSLTLRCGVLHVQQFVKYSVVHTVQNVVDDPLTTLTSYY